MNLWKPCLLLAIILLTGCSTTIKDKTVSPTSTGKIAFVSDRGGNFDIFAMNADGSGSKNLTGNPANDLTPAWSPDGRQIAFSSDRDGRFEIYIMNADGSQQTRLTQDKTGAVSPAWSSDGKHIVFLSDRDGVLSDRNIPISEVYIMDADGSEQQRLTNNHDFERELSWAPKGDIIAVSANVRAPSGIYVPDQIYLMGLDGVTTKQLTKVGYNDNPTWSPNGELIAFHSYDGNGGSGIYIMKADGSDQILLISSINSSPSSLYLNNLNPSWSPDGNYIVFSSNRDGNYDLYVMNANGSNLTRLTDDLGDETSPVWSPIP